jgi:hypothetical protein
MMQVFLSPALAQGRLVINEFMAWPNNTCGTKSEFIELKNLGPGTMDIGCYVITDGDFSITIPKNTMLGPGEFYVLGGMDVIPSGCANRNRAVPVNLNWYTSGTASGAIPETEDGFLTNGGTASEQIVLFNSAMQVIDAVVRSTANKETSTTITTVSAGGCSTFTFNLDNMVIDYEQINPSQGNGNSYARNVDGSCTWIKEPAQSGGDPNSVGEESTGLSIQEIITTNPGCTSGNAIYTVLNTTPSSYFPFNYTLGFDSNGDGMISSSDHFNTGTDATSPSIEFMNLVLGQYSVLLEPATGCDQRVFNFSIGPCITLPIKLLSFSGRNYGKQNQFDLKMETDGDLKKLVLESSQDGKTFNPTFEIPFESKTGIQTIQFNALANGNSFFKIRMIDVNGKSITSKIVNLTQVVSKQDLFHAVPNPFSDYIQITRFASKAEWATIHILSATGQVAHSEKVQLKAGENKIRLLTNRLQKGIYYASLQLDATGERQVSRIIKN